MTKLINEKLELLLKDLKEDSERQKETGRSFFNHNLFAVRVKEIHRMIKELDGEKGEQNDE